MTSMSSFVSLPHCCWTLPLNCFQLPSTRSQFIVVLPLEDWTLVKLAATCAVPVSGRAKKYGRSQPRRRLRPDTGLARGEGDGGRSQVQRASGRGGSRPRRQNSAGGPGPDQGDMLRELDAGGRRLRHVEIAGLILAISVHHGRRERPHHGNVKAICALAK